MGSRRTTDRTDGMSGLRWQCITMQLPLFPVMGL